LNNFRTYLKFLETNPEELPMMFNHITTNVTKFFREQHHFDFLNNEYLPLIVSKQVQPAGKKIRVWSAGCSTGQEPYTLSMTLHRFFQQKKGWDLKITASDINTDVLKKASEGTYGRHEVEDIPYDYLQKYFQLGTGQNKGLFRVKKSIREMVDFRQVNLASPVKYPVSEPLDIIFCRNVFIYFDKETRNKILYRFYRCLKPGGVLFLGHSESINALNGEAGSWRLIRHTVYDRLPEQ
jgi:chemotaxis protein methyltransferase CheR